MNFKWNMKEEEFNRYRRDCKSDEWISNDYYGEVLVGNLDIQFLITDENVPFTNWFFLHKETEYGHTESGIIPYSLLDNNFKVPIRCKTFESFKRTCENRILKILNSDKELLNEANWTITEWK